MTTMAQTLQKNNLAINAALVLVLAGLIIVSPAEATLGNVVKIVYAHGAAERVGSYAYLLAGVLGIAQLMLRRPALARWTGAVLETAIVFWLAQIIISLPAQILAWGGLTWNEPRIIGALWILGTTIVIYIVARWVDDLSWIALAGIIGSAILIVVLRGSVNILHPFNPIIGSDSIAIKAFYAAIVLVMGMIAAQFARYRAAGA